MNIHAKFPPVVQFLIWALFAYAFARYVPIGEFSVSPWLVGLMAIVGALFLSSALGSFRRNKTTINPLDPSLASKLVTSGLYRITRNPMYVGLAFLLLAWCFYLAAASAFLSVPLFVITMTFSQIKAEEAALVKQFGDDYHHYCASVKRWLFF